MPQRFLTSPHLDRVVAPMKKKKKKKTEIPDDVQLVDQSPNLGSTIFDFLVLIEKIRGKKGRT